MGPTSLAVLRRARGLSGQGSHGRREVQVAKRPCPSGLSVHSGNRLSKLDSSSVSSFGKKKLPCSGVAKLETELWDSHEQFA